MGSAVIRNPRNAEALKDAIDRLTQEWAQAEHDQLHGEFLIGPVMQGGVAEYVKKTGEERRKVKTK